MSQFWDNIFGVAIPIAQYCEKASTDLIARPGYFITNFAYIGVGLYLLFQKGRITKIFGILSILIGVCSSLYDASFRSSAQVLDQTVMFIFIEFLFLLNLRKLINLPKNLFMIIFFFLFVFFLGFQFILSPEYGLIPFVAGVIGIIAVWIKRFPTAAKSEKVLWSLSFLLFFSGYGFWLLDAGNILCIPNNLLNGRGVFHYLTSIIVLLWGMHYSKKQSIQ